jgi:hypothetical protein
VLGGRRQRALFHFAPIAEGPPPPRTSRPRWSPTSLTPPSPSSPSTPASRRGSSPASTSLSTPTSRAPRSRPWPSPASAPRPAASLAEGIGERRGGDRIRDLRSLSVIGGEPESGSFPTRARARARARSCWDFGHGHEHGRGLGSRYVTARFRGVPIPQGNVRANMHPPSPLDVISPGTTDPPGRPQDSRWAPRPVKPERSDFDVEHG